MLQRHKGITAQRHNGITAQRHNGITVQRHMAQGREIREQGTELGIDM
jgi:hypothetical protein